MNKRRREILKLMGLAPATGGLAAACTKPPEEEIVPYVHMLEGAPPAQPVFYASALPVNGFSDGILIETHQGRPIKIEGNPHHPVSRGTTGVYAQATLFDLYDPDRRRALLENDQPRDAATLIEAILARRDRYDRGQPLTLVTGPTTSQSLTSAIEALLDRWPQAQWRVHQPASRRHVYQATRLAYERALEPGYRFDRAAVVALFDADPCGSEPGALRYARDIASRRRLDQPETFSRIYAAESVPTPLGLKADERVAARPSEVEAMLAGLDARLLDRPAQLPSHLSAFLDKLAADLGAARGRGLVVAGPTLSPAAQALAMNINHRLGNQGATVLYRPAFAAEATREDLHPLPEPGDVYLVDCDPVATGSDAEQIIDWLGRADFSLHLSLHPGTGDPHVQWKAPLLHPLESWADGRACDGTTSIIQPGIAPLYGGWTALELVGLLNDGVRTGAYERLRAHWDRGDEAWHRALAEGIIEPAADPVDVSPRPVEPPEAPAHDALELALRPDPRLLDGSYAPNDWLQELPEPITTQVWGNSAWLSQATARDHDIDTGDEVHLVTAHGRVTARAHLVEDIADGTVAISLGHGSRAGTDAYPLRGPDLLWHGPLEIEKGEGRRKPATIQKHFGLAGRHPVEHGTLQELIGKAKSQVDPHENRSLYGEIAYEGEYAWGMMIDLNACIGCSTCTIACQAENNIPAVGEHEAHRGRVMHWIRVDRYRLPEHGAAFQPVPCMHCEKAPCEYVCPVAATVHDSEGLNVMVYNRCIGTRDCSQNCPYKVRRFNWLDYNHYEEPLKAQHLAPLRNPEVTPRQRGVMEKCNYCLQRISRARIEAKRQGRRIRDGEVTTACQQACPAQAITFGDLNDPDSAVRKHADSPHAYAMLAHLDTRPRTRYLPLARNPRTEGDESG